MLRKPVCFTLLLLAVMSGAAAAQSMPAPTSQEVFTYPPIAEPERNANPALAKPVGVGAVAEGGSFVNIRAGLFQLSEPVDIYILIGAPSIDPEILFVVLENGGLQTVADGIVPWRRNILEPISESLYGDIPVAAFIPGKYHIYLAVAPAGRLDRLYLWETWFEISDSPTDCGSYTGPRRFAFDSDWQLLVREEGIRVDYGYSGRIPFELDQNLAISGGAQFPLTIEGQADDCVISGSGNMQVELHGTLVFDAQCNPFLDITWASRLPIYEAWLICPGLQIPFSIPVPPSTYNLYIPAVEGHTITHQDAGAGFTSEASFVLRLLQ